MSRARHKNRYARVPAPGTLRRRVLDAALSSHGVRDGDIPGTSYMNLYVCLRYLEDEGGWDIRSVRDPQPGRHSTVWKIVGRWSWDGGYTDLVVNSLPEGWDS